MPGTTEALSQGARDAFDRHDWDGVVELLDEQRGLDGELLELLAEAACWAARTELVLPALEQAQAAFLRAGDRPGAARVTMTLAREQWERGATAVATGCIAHAGSLLDGVPECREHAMLAWFGARVMFVSGDADGLLAATAEALAIARRVGDVNVEALSVLDRGHAHLALGQIPEGLALVDEAMAFAMSGSLSIQTAGTIYCSTLWSCRNLGEWRRAAEWTDATMRWCDRVAVDGFPGVCRFHRAEVQRMRGAFDAAEVDARQAIDELAPTRPLYSAWGHMELGEINRRRGDFEAAEAAFSRANQLGFDPQPSWALARLQQGDLEGARVMIERTLASGPIPMREAGILSLPVAVSVYCELGRLERAGELADELTSLAEAVGTAHARAAALEARCEVQMAHQDFEGALESIHASWLLWSEIDAPYEQARGRVMRARVQHALGDDLSSRAELNTAIAAFETLGARSEAEAARRALTAPNVRGPREHATFVFIDMVGSTPLVEAIGDEAWAEVLADFERALRLEFERFAGHEANQEGDGFFVAFTDSTAALDCACAIQQHLAKRRTEDPAAPHVRIGLHTADAYQRGRDYSGLGVHAAARVSSLADADEILASAASLAEDRGVRTTADRRSLTLKGISDPIEVATVLW